MDTSDIVPSLASTKDTGRIGIEQGLSRLLINVMPRYEEYFAVSPIRVLDHLTQMSPCLRRKVFICIDKNNPISRHMGKSRIPCCRKIILPRPIIHCSSIRLRCVHCIILRACIQNNQLIHLWPKTFNGLLQMNSIIAHNIACRNAHVVFYPRSHIFPHICSLFFHPKLCLCRLSKFLIKQ